MDINIQNSKIELIQWLTTINDKSIIEKILDLKKTQSNDWWENISDSEKKSIENGLLDIEKGNLKSHSEARKIYEKWL